MDLRLRDGAAGDGKGGVPRPGAAPGTGPPVWTDGISAIVERGLLALEAGYGLHLRGPAGTGKSVLAAEIAARRGGRVIRLEVGQAEAAQAVFVQACAVGATLLCDIGAAPEEVLARGLAAASGGETLALGPGDARLSPNPSFRLLIVTGGRARLPDPLLDRLVTLEIDAPDRESEIAIVAAQSGVSPEEAAGVVDLVRDIRRSREYALRPSLRSSISLCRLARASGCRLSSEDPRFVSLVLDVVGPRLRQGADGLADPRHRQMLARLIGHFCGEKPRAAAA